MHTASLSDNAFAIAYILKDLPKPMKESVSRGTNALLDDELIISLARY